MFGKNIKLDEKVLLKNKIQLLNTNESWNKLFGDIDDKSIKNAKEELLQLISKEDEYHSKNKELQREKQKVMKMILGISDSINNENKIHNIELLDNYKNQMIRINEEIDDITFHLETIPKSIRDANLKLLNATVEYGYGELKVREKFVKEAVDEITILRKRLKELIVTRHNYEEWISETYTFFHGLLGSEIIEEIDKERLK